jgi:hypothetical protein
LGLSVSSVVCGGRGATDGLRRGMLGGGCGVERVALEMRRSMLGGVAMLAARLVEGFADGRAGGR